MLDRLSAPLCDALLERAGSRELLAELERSNLFLIPLDARRDWFRYHHLFQDLLRAELGRELDAHGDPRASPPRGRLVRRTRRDRRGHPTSPRRE